MTKQELANMLADLEKQRAILATKVNEPCPKNIWVKKIKCPCPSCKNLMDETRMVVQDIMMINEGLLDHLVLD